MNREQKSFRKSALAAAVALGCVQQVSAMDFQTDDGWKGAWNTTVSAATAWRANSPDNTLIGPNDAAVALGYAAVAGTNAAGTTAARNAGFLGASNSDIGNLNYGQSARYSTPFKVLTDLSMSRGDMGFKLGAKLWYDQTLKNASVPVGNQQNGFNGATSTPTPMPANAAAVLTTLGSPSPLSDNGFPSLNKFAGVELREAYAFNTFDVGNPLYVKAGNQIMKWGNSLFLQGLNQVSPVDLTALRKPGTEIEEGQLPIWAISGKLGSEEGMSLEAFFQLKARANNVESCGTYFGVADFGFASNGDFCPIAQVAGSPTGGWVGGSNDGRPDVMLAQGKAAKDEQGGLFFRLPVKDVGIIGLYAISMSSRAPYLGGQVQAPATPGAAAGATQGARMQAQWDYVSDLQVFGISALTKLDTWRLGAEWSQTPNQPVQINAVSMIQGGLAYATLGPVAGASTLNNLGPIGQRFIALGSTPGVWNYLQGYDTFAKMQLLLNAATPISKSITEAMGAGGGVFAIELGYQRAGVPDVGVSATGVPSTMLYGRAFIFGLPVAAANCAATGAAGTNSQPQGCQADGFFTPTAWGIRLRVSLDYLNVFDSDWKVTPSLYYANDLHGYSVDGQFNEGRQTLNLSLAMNLNKRHDVVLAYTTYNRSASYDAFRDRENYAATYRYKF